MRIDERGFWYGTAVGHTVDYELAWGLWEFFLFKKANTILDMGCGNGGYTKYLQNCGFSVLGVDGNPETKLFGYDLLVADLTIKRWFGNFDWVLSLEVGEHIPKIFESNFIDNLDTNNTKGIILSWSIPEFGGDGHVNSKTNQEVIDLITKRGYIFNEIATRQLRSSCAKYPQAGWWFSQTIMVFERIENV
jgi:cyclopropane fatty-acyl-phospholipid synthase-like methyltransferase